MLTKRGGKGIKANSVCANAFAGKGGLKDAEGIGREERRQYSCYVYGSHRAEVAYYKDL